MRFLHLRSSAMLGLVVAGGAASYELSPPRVQKIDLDALLALRGIDRAKYTTGPSLDDAIRMLGDDPNNAIEADDDPEPRPFYVK